MASARIFTYRNETTKWDQLPIESDRKKSYTDIGGWWFYQICLCKILNRQAR